MITPPKLVVYEAALDTSRKASLGELPYYFMWQEQAPTLDEEFQPKTRPWQILYVEEYICDGNSLYVAIIHPKGESVPDFEDWSTVDLRSEDPDYSLSICLTPEKRVLEAYWTPQVVPPSGRLAERQGDRSVLWEVNQVQVFKAVNAIRPSLYKTIHLGLCELAKVPA